MLEAHGNSSLNSTTEKENYPLVKVVNQFQEYLLDPSSISDNRMKKWSILFLLLIGLLTLLSFVSYVYYKETLMEVKGIISADGTINDIMQTA